MTHYVLFDTETTGNTEEDKVIQFGAIIVDQNNKIEVFDELCSTDIDIKVEAMEVHNITPDLLKEKPVATQTNFYKKLEELNLNENYLIAHNIKFDLSMIKKEGFQNNYTLIDTLQCAKHLFSDLQYHRLQYLRYKLDLYKFEEEESKKLNVTIKAHDAIGDVLVMKLLISKLVAKCREENPGCNPMKKLAELTQTPVLLKKINFGKYKGQEFTDIAQKDPGYLNWLKNNSNDLNDDLSYTINKVLNK